MSVEDAWSRHLAGQPLSDEDRQSLIRRLETDPEFRARAVMDVEMHGLLRSMDRAEADGEPFAQAFDRQLAREQDATRFLKKVESRLDDPPRISRRRIRHRRGEDGPPLLVPALAAAAALFGLLILAALSRTPASPPRDTARRSEGPVPPPPLPEKTAPAEAVVPDPPPAPPPSPSPKPEPPAFVAPPLTKEPGSFVRPPETTTPPVPDPTPASAPKTEAAVARVQRPDGRPAQDLRVGESVAGAAVLSYPDGTAVELSADAEATLESGKRLHLAKGRLRAQVTKQLKGQERVFGTPHGEVKVLGTTLRLVVEADRTRLEVEEGRVQLKNLAGRSVEVVEGHFAVASAGVLPVSRRLPVDDILLLPSHGKIFGTEWRRARDPKAVSETALEAAVVRMLTVGKAEIRNRAEFVEFAFHADGGRDYHVWVRGAAAAAAQRERHDAVALEPLTGEFVLPSAWAEIAAGGAFAFNGWGYLEGYAWIGNDADPRAPAQASARLRFAKDGRQVLRLYALEAPLRIDAIWLSTTQSTRPEPEKNGPGPEK